MDIHDLKSHIDQRFDQLEGRLDKHDDKLDGHMVTVATNSATIKQLQGSTKLIITIILAVSGAIGLAYLSLVKTH